MSKEQTELPSTASKLSRRGFFKKGAIFGMAVAVVGAGTSICQVMEQTTSVMIDQQKRAEGTPTPTTMYTLKRSDKTRIEGFFGGVALVLIGLGLFKRSLSSGSKSIKQIDWNNISGSHEPKVLPCDYIYQKEGRPIMLEENHIVYAEEISKH